MLDSIIPQSARPSVQRADCLTSEPNLVNMTDMILAKTAKQAGASSPEQALGLPVPDKRATDAVLVEMIELLFFAYRDFISDPDAILNEFAFGRAHHRVLYFVNRSPGLTVAELLDILKITKQSLGRVLRDLVEADFIVQRPGESDRRQRLLYPTPRGVALARRLTEPQMRRIAAALSALGPEGASVTNAFLRMMINEGDRATPAAPIARP